MARGYPRFLYSDPQNVSTPGPFIVHTLEPRFIVRVAKVPNYEPGRMTQNGKYVLFFLDDIQYSKKLEKVTDAMFDWIESQEKIGAIKVPTNQ